MSIVSPVSHGIGWRFWTSPESFKVSLVKSSLMIINDPAFNDCRRDAQNSGKQVIIFKDDITAFLCQPQKN
ncbi:putative amino-acid permease [Frankliniella fusca]|uniref:Amino-acid permease n=1 Tax=Frankliniella fusca TaxID=407009 RepID=A0AAE1H3F2_9NEOP|nr:putative amino-acid permease [Frankliniella fusca]